MNGVIFVFFPWNFRHDPWLMMLVVGDHSAGQVPGHNISICFIDMHFSRYHFYNFNPEKRQFWILKCGEWTPKGTGRGPRPLESFLDWWENLGKHVPRSALAVVSTSSQFRWMAHASVLMFFLKFEPIGQIEFKHSLSCLFWYDGSQIKVTSWTTISRV